MGELFEFKCPDYGYQAEVSGGEDCGMRGIYTRVVPGQRVKPVSGSKK